VATLIGAALCLAVMGAVAPLAQARKISTTHSTLLGPPSATNPIGTNHTLTATVLVHTENCDPDGPPPSSLPESGVNVKFEVVSGPNQGLTGSGVTNAQGHATFTYTSQVTGTDVLIATPIGLKNTGVCNYDDGPAQPSKQVEAIWVARETPKITIDDVTVKKEGNTELSPATPATFTVSLSEASPVPVTVDYATADGTATAPADYVPVHEQVTFNPGDPLTKTVTIDVNGDHKEEPTETFQVNLSNATNAVIADSQGIGTIIDDDGLIS